MQRSTSASSAAARSAGQAGGAPTSASERAPIVVTHQRQAGTGPSPADVAGHGPATHSPRAYWATLLTLARSITDARAAALLTEEGDGWRYLAEVAATDKHLARLHALLQAPPGRAADRTNGELCLVQIATRPALRMALLVPNGPPPATVDLLEQVLDVAVLIVTATMQERQLREAYRALLELEADLAQELRTPLTAVSGFTQLLRRGGEIDECRRTSYAAIASEETEQVASAIDQIIAKVQRHAAALASGSGGFAIPGEGASKEPDPSA